jgi:enterochelin esterase family protein
MLRSLLLLTILSSFSMAQQSPEVLPDKRVTFRFTAPKASEVKAVGQFGPEVVLTKGEKGLWSGMTGAPIRPGIFEYRFLVDGVATIDSRNRAVKPQRWPSTSILHLPASPPALWDPQDIPHGTLHYHDYQSKALDGIWRRLIVYTPPNADGPLPVLYLAHGYSDQEQTWTVHGKAHWILDALIAQKRAVPMIVVMSDAHAVLPETRGRDEFDIYGPENSTAFCQELLRDIIPLVEGAYPVNSESGACAFAGLSMGGHHALTIAMQHHAEFSQIGAFSSAIPNEETIGVGLAKVETINQDLGLLWIACGDKDFLFEENELAHAAFEEAGLNHEYVVTKGDNHSWPVWRRYLADFLPKLFR